MLKLIYSDEGLTLETVEASLETIVAQRLKLSLGTRTPFYLEPSSATFLLTLDPRSFLSLQEILHRDQSRAVEVSVLDRDCVEVTLTGVWVTQNPESESGLFLALLSVESESLLYNYWKHSELQTA